MWGNSNVYLPKEIILKPEEVRYWNGQELSAKPPLISQIDCAPSGRDEVMAEKIGLFGAVGVMTLSLFCPPAGFALALTYGAVAGGAKVVQHVATDEKVKDGAELVTIAFASAVFNGYDPNSVGGECLGHTHKK